MKNFSSSKIIAKIKRQNLKNFVIRSDQLGRPVVILNYLKEAGRVEQHDFAVDVTYILKGSGRFQRGGEIVDRLKRSFGEWRGKSLRRTRTVILRPGIFVVTEAGVPHRTIPGNSGLVYLTYKQYIRKYKIQD